MATDREFITNASAAGASEEINNPLGGLPTISKKKVASMVVSVAIVGALEYAGVVKPEHAVSATALTAAIGSMVIDWSEIQYRAYGEEFSLLRGAIFRACWWGLAAGATAALINQPEINHLMVQGYDNLISLGTKAVSNYFQGGSNQETARTLTETAKTVVESAVTTADTRVVQPAAEVVQQAVENNDWKEILALPTATLIAIGGIVAIYNFGHVINAARWGANKILPPEEE